MQSCASFLLGTTAVAQTFYSLESYLTVLAATALKSQIFQKWMSSGSLETSALLLRYAAKGAQAYAGSRVVDHHSGLIWHCVKREACAFLNCSAWCTQPHTVTAPYISAQNLPAYQADQLKMQHSYICSHMEMRKAAAAGMSAD